jgi:thiol-disulfide isomerase/thioredoxin
MGWGARRGAFVAAGAIALIGTMPVIPAGYSGGNSAAWAETPLPAGRQPAPEFPAGLKWLNTERPLTLAGLRGKVVLVDFWEYTCVNCIRTLPYLKAWHERYKDKGLVIVGVHAPEFDFAKEEANVARAAKEFGLSYPIVVDSKMAVWNAYGNRYWPAKYLIDSQGSVRAWHFGEGGYGDTEQHIQELLKEANPAVTLPPILEPIRGEDKPGAVCYPVTPEIYAGYLRASLGNVSGVSPDKVSTFRDPNSHRADVLYVHGRWLYGPEALVHSRKSSTPEDYVLLRYRAVQVNTVLKPERGRPVKLFVTQDGKPVARADKGEDLRFEADGRSYVLVETPRMYNLLKNAQWGAHTLRLATGDDGLGLYSFTFTSCMVPEEAAK